AKRWQSQGIALASSTAYLGSMLILLIALRWQIGKLDLMTPPTELLKFLESVTNPLRKLFDGLRATFTQICIAIGVFLAGLIGNFLNSAYTLRIAVGSILVVFLTRYPFALVIIWALVSVVMTDTIPIFINSNILTALTIPTLLLMIYLPVGAVLKRMPALWF